MKIEEYGSSFYGNTPREAQILLTNASNVQALTPENPGDETQNVPTVKTSNVSEFTFLAVLALIVFLFITK
ncbi:MAG: hypothetical protein IE890_04210 [Arcobacter sp.]|nr:hypothetical protein [Arcobacter sp.]